MSSSGINFINMYTLWSYYVFPWNKNYEVDKYIEDETKERRADILFWKPYVDSNVFIYMSVFMDIIEILSRKMYLSLTEIDILGAMVDEFQSKNNKILHSLIDK